MPALQNVQLLFHYKAIDNYNVSDWTVHFVRIKSQFATVTLISLFPDAMVISLRNVLSENVIH